MLPCLKYIIHTHKFWGTNSKGTLLLTVFRYQIYTYSLWIDISVAIAYILNMNTNISSFDPTPPTFRGLYRQIIHVQANTQSVIALGRICLSWKINIYVPSRVKWSPPLLSIWSMLTTPQERRGKCLMRHKFSWSIFSALCAPMSPRHRQDCLHYFLKLKKI